jgi:hypothetical protein
MFLFHEQYHHKGHNDGALGARFGHILRGTIVGTVSLQQMDQVGGEINDERPRVVPTENAVALHNVDMLALGLGYQSP